MTQPETPERRSDRTNTDSTSKELGLPAKIAIFGALAGVAFALSGGLYRFAKLDGRVDAITPTEIRKEYVIAIEALDAAQSTLGTPVGTILPFWGNEPDLARLGNYELCDGTKVTTEGSPILGTVKPDLRGRFIRGSQGDSNLVSLPVYEGKDEIDLVRTHGTTLTMEQMPRHTHVVTDPGHAHSVQNIRNAGNIYDSGGGRSAASYPSAKNPTSGRAKTSISVAVSGSSNAHDHKLASFDNRPRYAEVHFIIKVR